MRNAANALSEDSAPLRAESSRSMQFHHNRAPTAGECGVTNKLHSVEPEMRRELKNSENDVTMTDSHGRAVMVDLVDSIEEGVYLFRVIQKLDGEILIPWSRHTHIREYMATLSEEECTYVTIQQKQT